MPRKIMSTAASAGVSASYSKRVLDKTGKEPTRRQIEAHFAGDDDFSTEVFKKEIQRQIGSFGGSYFFTKLERIESEINSIANPPRSSAGASS